MTALKPRTATIVIYQGDDLEQLADLDKAVERAATAKERAEKAQRDGRSVPRLMNQLDPVSEANEAYDAAVAERNAFADEAEPRGVRVVLKAVHRKRWRKLMTEHPPRDGVAQDGPLGVNMETLPDVLLAPWMPHSAPGSDDAAGSIDLEESTIDGDLSDFVESLSDYDFYDRLFLSAYALNRGTAVADPTQRLGSAPSPTSAATSS